MCFRNVHLICVCWLEWPVQFKRKVEFKEITVAKLAASKGSLLVHFLSSE